MECNEIRGISAKKSWVPQGSIQATRYFVQDEEQQAQLATNVIENQYSIENSAFIKKITLCEIV